MSKSSVAFLDASFVVRYLTNDPPEMAATASAVIDSDQIILLSELVVVESAYVLTSVYQVPRDDVVDALMGLVQRRNIRVLGLPRGLVLQALSLCRSSNRVSFTDALLWAQAVNAGGQPLIFTFDRRFPRDGVELRDR